jgi:hypothetical protein
MRALTTVHLLTCYKSLLSTECRFTNFTRIWTISLMYITGISTYITVNMSLFIHRTLVTTQRLIITTYSLLQIKHQPLNLCHTCFTELFQMHSGTFLQQGQNDTGLKYFDQSN